MESPDGIFLAQPDAPAAGIPLAVKDLFDTAGLTTTYGSSLFADHVPVETAEAVRLLEAAGYANVGKTNLHEFAYGVTSMNPHFGWVPNPVAPGRIPGGSSGGSAAALAAGLAEAGVGAASGGSVPIPSACWAPGGRCGERPVSRWWRGASPAPPPVPPPARVREAAELFPRHRDVEWPRA